MYDLFVLGFLIIMVLFIGYNFYIDYSDWSNTGNSFAEGMASGQVIININSPKPTWDEFKDKMSAQSDISYRYFNSIYSGLRIAKTSPLSKMIPVIRFSSWSKIFKGKGGVLDFVFTPYNTLYKKTYNLPEFPWKKYAMVIRKPSWDTFANGVEKYAKQQGGGIERNGRSYIEIDSNTSWSKLLPIKPFSPNLPTLGFQKSKDGKNVILNAQTYMLSGFNWTKWPIAPASKWSSGGSCPKGCKEPRCVMGNCKDVTILGTAYKSCSGTCDTLNLDDKQGICKFDRECSAELCGEKYYIMDDKTPCTTKKWSNDAWNKRIGAEKLDPVDVNRSICPGIGGPYGCGSNAKQEERTIINEVDMKRVLANRNLIPIGINIQVDNQSDFIRIGKNLMNDVSNMRNVAIPNISDEDYETLGRVIAKLRTNSVAQNSVTTLKLTNSVNNILTGKSISNSQVDWGYEIPKSKRTTGMFGHNGNAMVSSSESVVKKSGYQLFTERSRSAVIAELTGGQRNSATPNSKAISQAIEAKWSNLTDEEKDVWKKKAIKDAKFREDIKKKAKLPDGGLCMWKGCERLGKSPYDSIWNLY